MINLDKANIYTHQKCTTCKGNLSSNLFIELCLIFAIFYLELIEGGVTLLIINK